MQGIRSVATSDTAITKLVTTAGSLCFFAGFCTLVAAGSSLLTIWLFGVASWSPATTISNAVMLLGLSAAAAAITVTVNGPPPHLLRAVGRTFARTAQTVLQAMGLTRGLTWRSGGLALVATALAFISNVGLAWLIQPLAQSPTPVVAYTDGLDPLDRAITFAVWGAPEELPFRGAVLIAAALVSTLNSRTHRVLILAGVVIVTTVTFGALHGGLQSMSSAALNGAVWSVLALSTRSLWPAILSHGLHNAVVGFVL